MYSAVGVYAAQLTVRSGNDVVAAAPIVIHVGSPPTVTITSPAANSTFRAGTSIQLAGNAVDPDGGPLPGSALTWTVTLRHNDHSHPFASGQGASLVVPVPTTGHTWDGSTSLLVSLTAVDSNGLSSREEITLLPEKTALPITSNLAGTVVTIDGIARSTPTVIDTIVGFQHHIEAPASVCSGSSAFAFQAWSSGAARVHDVIAAPNAGADDARYVASGTCSSSVAVSDLTPSGVVNGWGPFERDRSNGSTGVADGGTITLNGVTYAKGLGVHAVSSLTYGLSGASLFTADVGVDDEVGSLGSVVFQVFVDGVKRFDSGVMFGSSVTKKVSVDLSGAHELRLAVTDAGDGNGKDHADWANTLITSNL